MGRYDDRITFNNGANRNPFEVIVGFPPVPFKIRYIEIASQGSTANVGNHIVDLQAYDLTQTNVALNKPVTNNNGEPDATRPLSRVTNGDTQTANYAELGSSPNAMAVTTVDLQAEYDIKQIYLFRYYADGRTYYNTYVKVYNGDKSKSAYVHDYNVQGTYPETQYGRSFPGNHMSIGGNTWGPDWKYLDMYIGAADTSAKRMTRYIVYTTNYGDKQAYQNSGGYLRLGSDSVFNLNQNTWHWYCRVSKDAAGDRQIAMFGSTTVGWQITWMADGRIRWQTRYNGSTYTSYSSNYLPATGTFYDLYIDFNSTGTGAGTMNWGGTNSTANRSGRHQYSNLVLNIGTWGTAFRNYIRCNGINSSGGYVDRYGYINNLAVGSSNQTAGSLSTVNTTVTQDTWVTESWV